LNVKILVLLQQELNAAYAKGTFGPELIIQSLPPASYADTVE